MRSRTTSSIFVLLFGVCLFVPAGARRASSPAFGVNLLVNGNAEAGPGAPDDGATLMPIPGWKRVGVFQVVQYGASGGFADLKSPGPTDRGKNFFTGGPGSDNNQTSASQTINVASLLNGKSVKFHLSAYLGGFESQGDSAYVTASFLAAGGRRLGSAKLGPVAATDRHDVTGLLPRSKDNVVPAGTLSIVVTMVSVRTEGSYHDGCLDDVSLILKKA